MSESRTAARRALTAVGLAIFTVACVSRLGIPGVWDDSHIISRYAANWLASGSLSWNPGEPPTYGLTSVLYLTVVVPLRAALPDNAALAIQLASVGCGLAAFALLVALVRDEAPGGLDLDGALGLVAFVFAVAAAPLAAHFSSGMDTMFSVGYLAIYLLLLRRRGRPWSIATGLWGGLAFLARPDLLLITVAVPMVMALEARTAPERRAALQGLGIAVLVIAAQMSFTAWYFQSPLPLPFHAKGLHLYGDSLYRTYSMVALRELITFGTSYWFLFLPIVLDGASNPRRWRAEVAREEKAVLVGCALFLGYHAFLVLPIMYYDQRFYTPALPALLYLAVPASCRLLGRLEGLRWQRAVRGSMVALLATAALDLGLSGADAWQSWRESRTLARFDRFSIMENYRYGLPARVWRGLDVIAALPDDLTIATTEVGEPALMNPGKRIIDLAGLNNTAIALRHSTPAGALKAALPDVIYLPHPDYREMNRAIRSEPDLLSGYDISRDLPTPPTLQIAVRRTSPYYETLGRLVTSR